MRKISVLIQLLCCGFVAVADEVPTTSKISEVTVYRNQAKETRSLTVTIPKGNWDVVIHGISTFMVDNSLQVGVKGNATLLSATTRINYYLAENAAPKDPKSDRIKDSLKSFDLEIMWINEQKQVYTGETEMIQNNLKLGSEKEGMKPADLLTLAEFYRSRFMDLKRKLFDLVNKETRLTEKRNKYQEQLNEMGVRKIDPAKEIVLSFSSETGGELQIKPSYLVTQSGWAPMYDVKVLNTSKPVNIFYKAKIFQKTGYDWKDVKITISSANPSQNNNRPIMSPKFIDYITYTVKNEANFSNAAAMNMMQMEKGDVGKKAANYDEQLNYQVNVNESDINVEFEIDVKQNIPSDGKEHICAVQTYSVPATYKYHAVPKLDQSAFLLAKITDYGQYNLLAGQANIFYNDMYIGQTLLNPQVSSDTLLISLGKDERIVVKRNKIVDKSSRKILTDAQKDNYVYEIIIRNNKTTAIDIEILDQVPISKRTEIEVELIDKQGAEYTEEYGKLMWNYSIKPNESQKIRLSYSVKYPKGKVVQEQQ